MSTTTARRKREVAWGDPALLTAAAPGMRGIDFLRSIGRGELPRPPMLDALGIEPEEAEEGRVSFSVTAGEHHSNGMGMAHGGLAATLCDTAMGCAIHSLLPPGTGYLTLELSVRFVRPVTPRAGRLTCEGRVVHLGSRAATAEARLVDAEGTLYAHASTTCLLRELGTEERKG